MKKRPGTLAPREYEERARDRDSEDRNRSRGSGGGGFSRRATEDWGDEEDRLDYADEGRGRMSSSGSSGYGSSSSSSSSHQPVLSTSSAGNSTIRKRWEIRSSEVLRDGEKLGQGGFGAVYKGYVAS
jgi:hypothetical protein